MSINYAGLTDEYILKYQNRYSNLAYTNYATTTPATTQTTTGTYASGIQDSGFVANTCTDGKDDGKIGLGSALLNAGEGILKGAVNGLTGLLGFGKDENGKTTWNPLKLLGSVAVAAACVAFPAVGVAACAIGAVSGGAQVIKGAKAAANATTDAEAKAAWENMGEGTSTVVGCALGAKASVGAMKGSSMAAVDDALKGLNNGDDVVKALKGVDYGNIDDVTAALNKAGIKNVDEVNGAIGKFGADTSALGNLDDSLTGMEKVTKTAKAFGQDALSSTKNNGSALLAKTSSSLKTYKEQKTEYSEMKDMYNQHKKVVKKQEAGKTLTPEEQAILDNWDNPNTWNKYSQKNIQKLNKLNQEDFYSAELAKAIKSGNKSEISRIRTEYIEAKGPSAFGKLTTNIRNRVHSTETYQYLTQNETTSVIKNIKNINPLKVASKLGADGMNIYNFLKDGNNLSAAIKEFGYTDSMQVVQVLYSMGQVEQMV